ncbi:MAG: hypothetical protein KF787_09950 [Phycisphaeraceae bacterium]|nr:hypothetical protein [Phycisphaerae bacterium]MBX3392956.1 hypothetical protein [Phycisphaeraceae bacterium]
MDRIDRWSTRLTWIAAATVGLTAAATIPTLLVASNKPAWFLFAFEAVMPVPVVLAMLIASGRLRDPSGLGLGSVAGTILVGSLLGFLSIPDKRLGTPDGPIGQINMVPWVAVRVGAALAIAACAVRRALGNERRRWITLAWGLACGVGTMGIAACMYGLRNSAWLAPREGAGEALRMAGYLFAGIAVIAGLCAATHLTVKAFDRPPAGGSLN